MYQSTFKRYEKKYLLNKEQYNDVMNILTYNTVADKYGNSVICNTYYDTPDYRLIRSSIEGPVYKEKLRLRCYGIPDNDSTAFIELKKKYKGIVYKRRISDSYSDGLLFLTGAQNSVADSQIKSEIEYFLGYNKNLCPAMDIFYNRNAYYDRCNSDIRLTFDSNIICRNYELDLKNGIYGDKLLDDGTYILEIKTTGAMPMWIVNMLDILKIYPTSFSKYGTAYKRLNASKQAENNSKIIKFKGGFYCA